MAAVQWKLKVPQLFQKSIPVTLKIFLSTESRRRIEQIGFHSPPLKKTGTVNRIRIFFQRIYRVLKKMIVQINVVVLKIDHVFKIGLKRTSQGKFYVKRFADICTVPVISYVNIPVLLLYLLDNFFRIVRRTVVANVNRVVRIRLIYDTLHDVRQIFSARISCQNYEKIFFAGIFL